ncbi:uncharacterized protein DS421_17g575250 [Arachis hypogaea]|nr:uncharacterized protein DS421_17g575250 [Arachis hypogaea]
MKKMLPRRQKLKLKPSNNGDLMISLYQPGSLHPLPNHSKTRFFIVINFMRFRIHSMTIFETSATRIQSLKAQLKCVRKTSSIQDYLSQIQDLVGSLQLIGYQI